MCSGVKLLERQWAWKAIPAQEGKVAYQLSTVDIETLSVLVFFLLPLISTKCCLDYHEAQHKSSFLIFKEMIT